MKALAIIVMLLVTGDLAIERGAGVSAVGRAAMEFGHAFQHALAESLFAQ